MWYIFIDMYVCRQYYSSKRRKEILSFGTTWIDLGDIMFCEIKRQIVYYITYMQNLQKQNYRNRV